MTHKQGFFCFGILLGFVFLFCSVFVVLSHDTELYCLSFSELMEALSFEEF